MSAIRRAYEIDLAWASWRMTPIQRRAALRDRLAEAQNWRCCYCGCRMYRFGNGKQVATIEHVLPRSLDGTDDIENLAVACGGCNVDRDRQMWPVHIEALRIAGLDVCSRKKETIDA